MGKSQSRSSTNKSPNVKNRCKEPFIHKQALQQLEEDLSNFNVMENLSTFNHTKSINIKRLFYRSITLFVSALGRGYGLKKNSSFDIIEELQREDTVSEEAAQALSLAVAVACQHRLVHYSYKRRQEDNVYQENEVIGGSEKLKQLTTHVNQA